MCAFTAAVCVSQLKKGCCSCCCFWKHRRIKTHPAPEAVLQLAPPEDAPCVKTWRHTSPFPYRCAGSLDRHSSRHALQKLCVSAFALFSQSGILPETSSPSHLLILYHNTIVAMSHKRTNCTFLVMTSTETILQLTCVYVECRHILSVSAVYVLRFPHAVHICYTRHN